MPEEIVRPASYGKQVVVTLRSFVNFVVADEDFAVDIMRVREVIRLPFMAPVPNAPDFLEGIIHLRGRIVPIIDLRKRLRITGRDYKSLDRFTRVLIITMEGKWTGFIVDSVKGIIRVPQNSLKPVPDVLRQQVGGEYFDGVIQMEDKLVILLNLHKILSPEERDMLQDLNIDLLKKMLIESSREV
ncbi:MAG: chemotaxis protein CheW [Candidatus Methanomethyliaceae archaeon]